MTRFFSRLIKQIENKPTYSIIIVFAISLFFRFFLLSAYPVSLSTDEVAIGINAYEILKTGHDEHGKYFPLAFESVGDFKPPVDVYLTSLSEAVFGLNEFAVQFPVAFLGSLSAVFLILFLKKLGLSWFSSIFGGFWLGILPWHIHFSRGGFEAVTALFFMILGTWGFLKFLENQKLWTALLTVISLSLSVWTYHSERFFVPLLFIFLLVIFWKEIKLIWKKIKKHLRIILITFLFFAVPFINLAIFTPAVAERAASTSILRESSLVLGLHTTYNGVYQEIFDNNYFHIFRHWAGKYLNYHDIRFWFWKGLQFTPPGYADLGLLYAVDLPIFLVGIYSLVKSKNNKLKHLTLFWFFAGPLPASFTMNEQHPLRALIWIPFFALVIASGVEFLKNKIPKLWYLVLIYFAALIFSVIYFGDIYMNQFPIYYAESWQYGYKQAAVYACDNLQKYDKIIISDTFGIEGPLNTGVPFLYDLFYCPADMNNYLITGQHLSKFNSRRPNKASSIEKGRLLLIGSPWDFLNGDIYGGKIVNEIKYPGGQTAFIFVEIYNK